MTPSISNLGVAVLQMVFISFVAAVARFHFHSLVLVASGFRTSGRPAGREQVQVRRGGRDARFLSWQYLGFL